MALAERVTAEELKDAWRVNHDGGGAAWRHGETVRWRKGVSLKKLQDMAAGLPLPYVMHVRYATVGGVDRRLTHPFPLDAVASLTLRGKTTRGVLFHNGHYGEWDKAGVPKGLDGPWSDSRMLTWEYEGYKDIKTMSEALAASKAGKFLIFTPTLIYKVGGFSEVRPGLLASNLHWQPSQYSWGPDDFSTYGWGNHANTQDLQPDYDWPKGNYGHGKPFWEKDLLPTAPTVRSGEEQAITAPRLWARDPAPNKICGVCHKPIAAHERLFTRVIGQVRTYEHVECWQKRYSCAASHTEGVQGVITQRRDYEEKVDVVNDMLAALDSIGDGYGPWRTINEEE